MRFLIVSTIVPFIEGGGTFIVDWLDRVLKENGYQSEVLKIPFHSDHRKMIEQMVGLRLLNVEERVDRLIAIRTPSYLLRHPNKYLWFIHHHRGAYDLWGTQYQDIPNTQDGLKIRETFIAADNLAFSEAKKIYTNSQIVSDRLKKYNNFNSKVLYPPLMNSELYHSKEYGDYIFYPSRLTHHKRQHLAIEAMRYSKSGVKLIIAGKPESSNYLEQMKHTISRYSLEDKVKIIDRWISDAEKIDLISRSLGCTYIPYDEDSYGYPSLEAYHSFKPVITCNDSGGTLELVEDGLNGFITSSDPKDLADSFDRLYHQKQLAKMMGHSGNEKLKQMDISWDNVIRRFTE